MPPAIETGPTAPWVGRGTPPRALGTRGCSSPASRFAPWALHGAQGLRWRRSRQPFLGRRGGRRQLLALPRLGLRVTPPQAKASNKLCLPPGALRRTFPIAPHLVKVGASKSRSSARYGRCTGLTLQAERPYSHSVGSPRHTLGRSAKPIETHIQGGRRALQTRVAATVAQNTDRGASEIHSGWKSMAQTFVKGCSIGSSQMARIRGRRRAGKSLDLACVPCASPGMLARRLV